MPQVQRHICILRRIVAGPVKGNQIEGHLGLAPAGHLLEGDHLAAEMLRGEGIDGMAPPAGIQTP